MYSNSRNFWLGDNPNGFASGVFNSVVTISSATLGVAMLPATFLASPFMGALGWVGGVAGGASLGINTGMAITGKDLSGRPLTEYQREEQSVYAAIGWLTLGVGAWKTNAFGTRTKALTIYKEYPGFGGFLGNFRATETALPGQILSRIGSLNGKYASPPGTSLSARGLSLTYPNKTETLWKVLSSIEYEGGIAAPWKDAKGMGLQLKLDNTIQELWDAGKITPYSE